ncbi:Ig-like V-type domain-containing protein FAM187A isoform X2 [Paramacrobiotus metropolitanus]|uniref:Ig-like V-type domain-containing protein FAM187A isoform X2 n=1 Tax=Paramacrobiotus metropolitanus TaxID=2943436 RepID=UPI00244622FE|nr:Ig-like V-type domain-containing protein FAM187A isoform X2 [Paramacrobiotus metropolitanus]
MTLFTSVLITEYYITPAASRSAVWHECYRLVLYSTDDLSILMSGLRAFLSFYCFKPVAHAAAPVTTMSNLNFYGAVIPVPFIIVMVVGFIFSNLLITEQRALDPGAVKGIWPHEEKISRSQTHLLKNTKLSPKARTGRAEINYFDDDRESDAKGDEPNVARYNHSSSEDVQVHYRQSLEYYRRARHGGPIVEEYLNCVTENALLYEKVDRITSEANMKLMGQDVTIKCGDCRYPGKENAKATFDLTITDLNDHDSGRYFCVSDRTTVRVYDIQVVENEPTTTVFENSADGPLNTPSEELNVSNIRIYTHWDTWAGCNECGKGSTRRRVGICTVQKQRYNDPTLPVDYPIFGMFALGVPCRSLLLPANFTAEFRQHLQRPSEVLIGHCHEPCPTLPPVVFVTDESGRIVDQYEQSEGKVQILDAPPKLPPLVQRETVHEKEESRVRISCPRGAKKSVRWQNCSTTDKGLRCRPVDPFGVEKSSQGRVRITILNALLIKKLKFWDAGIFSCYYDGRLVATTKLFVQPRVRRPWRMIITVAGISFIVMFFIIGICYVVKNT